MVAPRLVRARHRHELLRRGGGELVQRVQLQREHGGGGGRSHRVPAACTYQRRAATTREKRMERCSDGVEDQGAEEALYGARRRISYISFGKSRLTRAARPFSAVSLVPSPLRDFQLKNS
jgi:hypothetical protein